jgi:hypothetical protein
MKMGLDASVLPKMSSGVQNEKTGTDALGTVENQCGSKKHEYGTQHPFIPLKTSPTTQNIKTRYDALCTTKT